MFTIRVRNFQSIRDAHLEVSGLTVVTGPNNSGKSALVRAFGGAFTNPRGHRYVRDGSPSCRVDLAFGDGRSLSWEKGPGENRYVLDGKTLDKVGSGSPPEISSLGVVPVEAAGREVWPQLAPQFTGQVFLLDEPGSVLAEAIADVNRVGVLNEALRLSQSDRRAAAAELKVHVIEVARLETQERAFDGLDEALSLCERAEALSEELERARAELSAMRSLRDQLAGAGREVVRWEGAREVPTPSGPAGEVARAAFSEWAWASSRRELQGSLSASVAARSGVRGVSLPTDEASSLLVKIDRAKANARDLTERLGRAVGAVQAARGLRAGLVGFSLPAPPEALPILQEVGELKRLRTALGAQAGALRQLGEVVQQLGPEVGALDEEVAHARSCLGECPLCGSVPTVRGTNGAP